MTRAKVYDIRGPVAPRHPALVWLLLIVASWALVAIAYLLLPVVVAQGGVGLLAILACGLLVAVTR